MFKRLAGTFFSNVYAALVNFGLLMLSAYFLGASGRGEISLFMANLAFVQLFAEIMNGPALIYLVPRIPLFHLFLINILWALIVPLIVVPVLNLSGYIETGYFNDLLILSCMYSVYSSGLMLVQGKQLIRLYVFFVIFQSTIQLGGLLYMFYYVKLFKPEAWFLPMYISYGGGILLIWLVLVKYFKKPSFTNFVQSLKKSFSSGTTAQVSNFLNFLTYRSVFYILVAYDSDKTSLGIYSVAASVIESVWLISFSLAAIQYPRIANEESREKSVLLSADFFKIATLLSIPAILVLLCIPATVYTTLLGKDFNEIKEVMVLLAPGVFFLTASKILWNYFSGTGQFNKNNVVSLIGVVINVLIALWLISQGYNASGAAIACSVSYVFISIFQIRMFMQDSNYSWRILIPNHYDIKKYYTHVRNFWHY